MKEYLQMALNRAFFALLLGVLAAPPVMGGEKMAYHGMLTNSQAQPVTGQHTLTFRLYASEGATESLWEETHTVEVTGGYYFLDLGSISALEPEIFRDLPWLGITVAGDAEMQPRVQLTSAPRALGLADDFKHVLRVPADGSALENGAHLRMLIDSLGAPAVPGRAVALDAGIYDLGESTLQFPANVTLTGQGVGRTILQAAVPSTMLRLGANNELSSLSVINRPSATIDSTIEVSAIMTGGSGWSRLRDLDIQVSHAHQESTGRLNGVLNHGQEHFVISDSSITVNGGSSAVGIRPPLGLQSEGGSTADIKNVEVVVAGARILNSVLLWGQDHAQVRDLRLKISYAFVGAEDVATNVVGLNLVRVEEFVGDGIWGEVSVDARHRVVGTRFINSNEAGRIALERLRLTATSSCSLGTEARMSGALLFTDLTSVVSIRDAVFDMQSCGSDVETYATGIYVADGRVDISNVRIRLQPESAANGQAAGIQIGGAGTAGVVTVSDAVVDIVPWSGLSYALSSDGGQLNAKNVHSNAAFRNSAELSLRNSRIDIINNSHMIFDGSVEILQSAINGSIQQGGGSGPTTLTCQASTFDGVWYATGCP